MNLKQPAPKPQQAVRRMRTFWLGLERETTTPLQCAASTASLWRRSSSPSTTVSEGPSTASSACCQSAGMDTTAATGAASADGSSCIQRRGGARADWKGGRGCCCAALHILVVSRGGASKRRCCAIPGWHAAPAPSRPSPPGTVLPPGAGTCPAWHPHPPWQLHRAWVSEWGRGGDKARSCNASCRRVASPHSNQQLPACSSHHSTPAAQQPPEQARPLPLTLRLVVHVQHHDLVRVLDQRARHSNVDGCLLGRSKAWQGRMCVSEVCCHLLSPRVQQPCTHTRGAAPPPLTCLSPVIIHTRMEASSSVWMAAGTPSCAQVEQAGSTEALPQRWWWSSAAAIACNYKP